MDMPSKTAFEGIWLPMVTPMRGGRLDLDAAQALARYYRNAGLAGLVLFGSTGEGNLLSLPEKIEMIEAIASDPHALPLVFGAGGVDTRGVAAAIRRLDKYRPAGYLVPPPYYLGPAQAGILWHYRQIAWATDRPIILYNIPKRAGVTMTVETMEALAAQPNFTAVKECNPSVLAALNARGTLTALCGEDLALPDHFLAGGRGAIPAAAHLFPDRHVEIMQLARDGHAEAARELFEPLRGLIRLLFAEPNPAPIKRALALQGLIADELRMPMTSASRELGQRLQRAMNAVQDSPSRLRTA
ncbi:Dihydrodipicolinate synthase [Achromobacter denitrificans]|uniref:4-hydroxy-tetrahydrodipicolinate synthase family protein n=1 Tax=Achromobacter denitrificans TaxID=32002 RepID=UPI0007887AC1|nr:4-hydroxy-tetrahydrodipicolinate synthase [Achromobacter denitrificans]OLU09930.1 4-hydroxy-tetrahydrodipicolinate synthase [Achromobacter denitrificans]QKH45206.1 4-hydroxy-tetrahydrodipicolinate synthase [Achromobacter denitrificans]QKH53452.1 4-hydroxy-tetrahydrodipicolinate synthase [Achromobacter denitrificans]CAB3670347.1 4-hydroxy-tetrahydrodipicolinate synthase [Achromobacter denitrificans]SUW34292.1 Dihydrodipicolinate synthase [Achromobacter denitrificans]